MKIVFFADGPWAHNAFKKVLSGGYQIVLVVLRYETRDPILRELAEKKGIDVSFTKNVNAAEFLQKLDTYHADIGVSLAFNQILRRPLLYLFPLGVINVHAGKLPEYRGRNILNWALINDEQEIGVTCHYIDEGIDTGDIIRQATFSVSDDDDYGTILSRAFEVCPKVLLEALIDIENNTVDRKSQPLVGNYCVGRQDGDEFIDWSWSARRIFNHVRAINRPGPGARTWLRRKDRLQEIIIWRIRIRPDYKESLGVNGSITGYSESKRPLIKVGTEVVELIEYEGVVERAPKLKIGQRLGFGFDIMNLLIRANRDSIISAILKCEY